MSEHTPGPWKACIHTGSLEGEAHINGSHGCCIAYVGFGTETERHYVTGEEANANAHLIAAAPDLLAALKAALPFIERSIEGHAAVTQIGAAIAKAEGGS